MKYIFRHIGASILGGFLGLLTANPLQAQQPSSLVPEMVAAGASVRSGSSDDHGAYVVIVVRLWSADAPGMARARKEATHVVGEYLGVDVSSAVKSSYEESSDSSGRDVVRSSFSRMSTATVDRAIAGMQSLAVHGTGEDLHLAFLLSTKGSASAVKLTETVRSRSVADGKPVTVESLGVAPLSGAVEQAEVLALAAAKQEALEMVVGVAMHGYAFALQEEDEAKAKNVFRQAAFSTTSGCIERFEVVSKGAAGDSMYAVRIRAEVSTGKLLDNYRVHLEAMGSPTFAVKAGSDAALGALVEQHFLDKGFRVVRGQEAADWVIELEVDCNRVEHPVRKSDVGALCALAMRVRNSETGELLAGVQTAGNASDFSVGGEQRQRSKAAAKAFRSAVPALEKQLSEGICRIAREGREVHFLVALPGEVPPTASQVDQLQESWRTLPGLRLVRVVTEGGRALLVIRTPLRSASLPAVIADDLCALWPDHELRVDAVSDTRVEAAVVPFATGRATSR